MIKTQQHDPAVREKFDAMVSRRRELAERLTEANRDREQILINLGAWVAEGCDYEVYTARLAELRLETEALEAGILYVDGQAELLKRSNYWLTR